MVFYHKVDQELRGAGGHAHEVTVRERVVPGRVWVRGSSLVVLAALTFSANAKAATHYSASNLAKGNAENHGEIVNAYFSVFGATIRFNQFRNAYLDGGGTSLIAIAAGRSELEKPSLEYNNTFVNGLGGTGIQFPDGSGNIISNNLWIGSGDPPSIAAGSGGIVSHNAFGPGTNSVGTNPQAGLTTAVFRNVTVGDLRLAAPTAPGSTLGAAFQTDLLGNTRGADGAWDRGAFEFSAGVRPASPRNLQVR